MKLSGLLGGTFKIVSFLLLGNDDKKKQQIINYAHATLAPKLEEVATKVVEAAAEGAARGFVEGAKSGN